MITVWSAVLTPGDTTDTGPHGYCRTDDDGFCIKRHHHGRHDPHGSLTDGEIEIDQATHLIQSLRYGAANPDGKLHLTVFPPFAPDVRSNLVLQIGGMPFSLASAFADFWEIGGNYTWTGFAEPWEVGVPIRVSLKKPSHGYAGHTPDTANTDLRLGVSKPSRLETGDDRDWFRVDLVAGVSYHFHVRGPRPVSTHLDWYQLDLDINGLSHLVTRDHRQDEGSLRIALYDHQGEPVRHNGAPVSDEKGTSWYRAGMYYQPVAGGVYYLEVASPASRPVSWYAVGYWEREPGAPP